MKIELRKSFDSNGRLQYFVWLETNIVATTCFAEVAALAYEKVKELVNQPKEVLTEEI